MVESITIKIDASLNRRFQAVLAAKSLSANDAINRLIEDFTDQSENLRNQADEKFFEEAIEETLANPDHQVVREHLAAGRPVYYVSGEEPEEGMVTKEYPSGRKEFIRT